MFLKALGLNRLFLAMELMFEKKDRWIESDIVPVSFGIKLFSVSRDAL